ncbi:hypothetical protein, partial [Picosynechococcus sp. PCC 7002]|uniref:hypothetical protein n=1 Tax=Picosynechococcus sp. (strain ATCC 27264 / PCC 7002 / PR-6) TaxID=32049 RepID=UPI001C3C660D
HTHPKRSLVTFTSKAHPKSRQMKHGREKEGIAKTGMQSSECAYKASIPIQQSCLLETNSTNMPY